MIRCLLVGHDWRYQEASGHSFCRRCERYDDHPSVVRAEKIMSVLRRWSPIWITVRRRDLTARVGLVRPELNAHARLHYGVDRTDELPGFGVTLTLWRLRLGLSVGHGWQDEDGDTRSLLSVWASFQTYGLRWVGCWLGHKPTTSILGGSTFCTRCDETLERAEKESVAA